MEFQLLILESVGDCLSLKLTSFKNVTFYDNSLLTLCSIMSIVCKFVKKIEYKVCVISIAL